MARLATLFLVISICISCTCGIRNIKHPDGTEETGPYLEIGQLQTVEGYNSLYTNKGIGWDSEIPVPLTSGYAVFKIAFGYLNSTRLLLDKDANIVLDVVIDPFNKGEGVTDTLIHGKDAIEKYAEYYETSSDEEPEPEPEGDVK